MNTVIIKAFRFITILTLLQIAAPSYVASQQLNQADKQKVIAAIEASATTIKSLQCDFTQKKSLSLVKGEMSSQGHMYYKGGDQLRWEYSKPYTYTFILSKGKVTMRNSQKKTTSIDVKGSRLFQEITRIMMNSVTGKCLSSKDFKVTIYAHEKEWQTILVPNNKEMRKMFSQIILHISKTQKMVTRVEMKEQSGDTTTIILNNTKKNVQLPNNLFTI